ncbi:AMP-binding protein [Pandoraea sp.]|uniref:AMP-binding protein n=1 Tax=Pandoraea sp. TaxID=1883445 RepID=UPI00120F17EC|nr:AMP-binding protein [Pandoraea sp.]TAL53392.1 MAG: AMP-dependent synthetase [Pandoraea sp.]TAM20482.1 MAG: AMP-dependent synthetase [Pandoraea sp.]
MHPYPDYFPRRYAADQLDTAPLIFAGLSADTERPVVAFDGQAIARPALRQQVAGWQAWLRARALCGGDRVAVMLENSAEQIALIYALILSGLVWVPVNTKLRGMGLRYLMEHAEPRLLVSEAAFDAVLDEAGVQPAVRARLASAVAELPRDAEIVPPAARHDDPLCIIYTSGTTGAPKGVIFTHRMMRISGEAALLVADARAADRLFLWEPLCHIGGAQMLLLPFLEDVELHVVSRFSASQFWQQFTRARATQLHYLGGILDILMRLPADAQPAEHTLRVAWGAGVTAGAWQAIRERLKCELRECYGMTECSSFATLNDTGKPGSIGRPLPWLRLELLDDEGREVPPGQSGEIVLSSDVDGVFLAGYLHNDAATRAALRGGKLHTGDAARRDAEGDLFFVGRRTDSMRVRGENVSAWEIERVFAAHPAVHMSAALGVASSVGEQEILLCVQFRDNAAADWPALVDWAAKALASFQLPRYYRRVEYFEMTPSERIKKHLLSRDIDDAWDRLAR